MTGKSLKRRIVLQSVQRRLLEYFKNNLGIYVFVTTFFLAGIAAGALIVRFLEVDYLEELQTSFVSFLQSCQLYSRDNTDFYQLLKISYQKNFIFLAITWFLGLFWSGFPFVLLVLLLKGLALGFTVGFLVYNFALRGFFFSLAALLPHNIVLIPAFLFAAAIATTYSYMRFKHRFTSQKKPPESHFLEYSSLLLISFFIILIGGFVEAYLSPVFIQLVVSTFF